MSTLKEDIERDFGPFFARYVRPYVDRFSALSVGGRVGVTVGAFVFFAQITAPLRPNAEQRAAAKAAREAANAKAWEDKFNSDVASRMYLDKDGYWTVRGDARQDETARDYWHRKAEEKRDMRELGLDH